MNAAFKESPRPKRQNEPYNRIAQAIEHLAVAAHQVLAALTVHFHIACKSKVRVCLHVVHDIDGFVITKQMRRGHLRQASTCFNA
jgi:hypothetical protein